MHQIIIPEVGAAKSNTIASKALQQNWLIKVAISRLTLLLRAKMPATGPQIASNQLHRALKINALWGIFAVMNEVYERQQELDSEWQRREKETFERGTRLLQAQIQGEIPLRKAREISEIGQNSAPKS